MRSSYEVFDFICYSTHVYFIPDWFRSFIHCQRLFSQSDEKISTSRNRFRPALHLLTLSLTIKKFIAIFFLFSSNDKKTLSDSFCQKYLKYFKDLFPRDFKNFTIPPIILASLESPLEPNALKKQVTNYAVKKIW